MIGKLYVFIGIERNGKRILVNRDCPKCHGLGHRGKRQGLPQWCGCLKSCDLPINWIILPRRAA